jgi:TolB-like protein/DNA-binding winged helix-turn-helix (wHTH) protein
VDNKFKVGGWAIDSGLNSMSYNGTTVRIEPKVMQVLVCLASQPGESVSKETILKTVWPDTFVTDDVLTRSISELRRAFEDDAKEPRVIQTIPKRGYRLMAAVEPVNGKGPTPDAILVGARRGWSFAALVLGLTIACGVGLLIVGRHAWFQRLLGATRNPQIQSLAVLPLQNLSGDPAQDYFSDGMTEELITELSRISGMKVISRTSVMRYKNTDKSLPEIARQLGVDGIVEGSVLRSGGRVRITAQLIYARTDANVWAETYDRDSQDVFGLQEAVASAIANKVKATMIPNGAGQQRPVHAVNFKAHEAYLKGFHEDDISGTLFNRQGRQEEADEHHRRAIEYYKEAIKEDPGFGLPYLYLATDPTSIEDNEAAARKALEIDETLGEAHLYLGAIMLVRDLKWQAAEKEMLRAIELNPNNATAHHAYAYFLDAAGRLDEGMKEWERAQELDPANDHLAGALYSRRQYDRLIELEHDELARNTDGSAYVSAVAHKTLSVAYARLGKHKEAVEESCEAMNAYGYTALAEAQRRGYARGGYEGALRAWLKATQKQKPEFPFRWVAAWVHAELGDYDAALAWLPKMKPDWEVVAWQSANVFPNLVTLRIEPMWDPLRADPRFEELVQRVGFPQ